jgi:hypothetical protein
MIPEQTKGGQALAYWIGDEGFEAHRGAFVLRHRHKQLDGCVEPGDLVVFGNDGYAQDVRAQREVEAAVALAVDLNLRVIHFGTTSDSYTWALVLRTQKDKTCPVMTVELEHRMTDCLWRAWVSGETTPVNDLNDCFCHIQGAIADKVIARLAA